MRLTLLEVSAVRSRSEPNFRPFPKRPAINGPSAFLPA